MTVDARARGARADFIFQIYETRRASYSKGVALRHALRIALTSMRSVLNVLEYFFEWTDLPAAGGGRDRITR